MTVGCAVASYRLNAATVKLEVSVSEERHNVFMSHSGVVIGGRPTTIYGSEFFYFRHDASDWETVINRLRDAHCNTVTLVIPWNWHLLNSGEYDFVGQTDSRRDLIGVLDLLARKDMNVIARPGPYICAEWENGGIPETILQTHPEILALSSDGRPLAKVMGAYPVITYLHPGYLRLVSAWYDAVCDVLRPAQSTLGGPVISVEIDDEPSYWMTIAEPLSADFNPIVVDRDGLFNHWLQHRYGSVATLNSYYGTNYSALSAVDAPRALPDHPQDYPRFVDWHLFRLAMVNQYVHRLASMLSSRGIDVPLSLLDPYLDFDLEGWEELREYCDLHDLAILPTTEIYPAGVWGTYRTSHIKEDAVQYLAGKLAIYRSLARQMDAPSVCIEAQAAATYHLDPDEADFLYHMLLAYGIDHVVYWTLPSGTNPLGRSRSFTGTAFDTSNVFGPDGRARPHFGVIERLGRLLEHVHLGGFEVNVDVAVGFYEPYRALSYVGDTLQSGLQDNIGDTLRQSFFPSPYGMVSLLALSNVSFDAIMLRTASVESLLEYRQLWVFSFEIMDRSTQVKLLDYVRLGGTLVLLPRIPTSDLDGRSCRVLADAIGAQPLGSVSGTTFDWLHTPRQFVRFDGSPPEVLVFDYAQTYALPPDAEPIVWLSSSDAVCGFSKTIGRGRVLTLGFKPSYTAESDEADRKLIWRLLDMTRVGRKAWSENEDLVVVMRSRGSEGFLFVLNATGWPAKSRIHYMDPETGAMAELPRILEAVEMPRRGGLVLPLNLPVQGTDATIRYASSEIVEANGDESQVNLVVWGPADTSGEVSIRLGWKPRAVAIDGKAVTSRNRSWDPTTRTLALTYELRGKEVAISILN
jgi:beta-galactosidase